MRIHFVESEPRQRTMRKGFFARILEALHRSRRRDAIRALRRYRHLTGGKPQIRPAKPTPESRQTEKNSRNAHGNNTLACAIRRARQNARNEFA
jgi:hypothetical protein